MAKDHGPSVKNDKQYEGLRKKGMSKQRAASIANSPEASKKGGEKSGKGKGGSKSQKRAAGREGGKKSGKSSYGRTACYPPSTCLSEFRGDNLAALAAISRFD